MFGRNGLGKSSIVEAVRWCLFGLADRPETEVRNVFYSAGECNVELELEGPVGDGGSGAAPGPDRIAPGSPFGIRATPG